MPAYKDKTTGKWYVQFWHTDYHGKKKKKMKRGFDRKSDALKWESEYKLKMAGSPDMTFASLMEHYLDDCRTRLKETTMQGKQVVADKHLLPFFGALPIADIKPRTVRSWQNELLKLDYKPSYLKKLHNQLSSVFNYGIRYYGLHENPANQAGSIGKTGVKIVNFWTVEDFERFNEQASDEELKLLVTLLFWTGMRIGEALAVTLNDFDLANKTVTINKTKTRLHKRDIITAPKTEKSNRVITLPDNVVDELQRYLETLYDYHPHRQLFAILKTTMYYRFAKTIERAGVPKIRIHDLRHSHASLLIEMGFPPLLISERLGHENVSTTLNVYSHLYPNKQQNVAMKLNNLKNGIKPESGGV